MLYSTKPCTDLLTLLAIFIFGTGACTWGVLYPSGVNKGHGCRSPWPFFVLKAMGKPMALFRFKGHGKTHGLFVCSSIMRGVRDDFEEGL
jgi:hypothetical protein